MNTPKASKRVSAVFYIHPSSPLNQLREQIETIFKRIRALSEKELEDYASPKVQRLMEAFTKARKAFANAVKAELASGNWLSYSQALEQVEKFIRDSGIREYCTTVCKGNCCRGCRVRSCDTGSRKITCSFYLCSNILNVFPQKYRVVWDSINEHIYQTLKSYFHYKIDVFYDDVMQAIRKCYFSKAVFDQIATLSEIAPALNRMLKTEVPPYDLASRYTPKWFDVL